MHGSRHNALATVVIDFNMVEALHVREVLVEEDCYVALDSGRELLRVIETLPFVVDEGAVCNGQVLYKHSKGGKLLFSSLDFLPFVIIVSGQKRSKVEWHDVEALVPQELFISLDEGLNRYILLMEYKRDNVILGYRPRIAGFVDKDREFLHEETSNLHIKMPGDIPRLLEVPLFEGTNLFIPRGGTSIQAIIIDTKHMFVNLAGNLDFWSFLRFLLFGFHVQPYVPV